MAKPHLAVVPDVVPLHASVDSMLSRASDKLTGGRAIVIGFTADGALYCDSTITDGPQTVFALEWAKSLAMAATIHQD